MTGTRPHPAVDPDPAAQLTLAFAAAAAVLLAAVLLWPGAREALFHQFNALGGVEATVGFWAGVNALADTWLTLGLLLPFVLWRPRIAILVLFAAIVATLDYAIVQTDYGTPTPIKDGSGREWIEIYLGETKAYVPAKSLRRPSDSRACFTKRDDRWLLTHLSMGGD